MTWCKLYDTDGDGVAAALVRARLGCSAVEAEGWMARLYRWATRHARSGALPPAEALEASLSYAGQPGVLVGALVDGGAVERGEDGGLRLVDWLDRFPLATDLARKKKSKSTDGPRTFRGSSAENFGPSLSSSDLSLSPSSCISSALPVPAPSAPTTPEAPLVLAVAEPSPSRSARRRPARAHPEGEVDPSDAESPVVVELASTAGPVRLREAMVARLAAAHPAVDVPAEARRAAVWLDTHRAERKTPRGMGAFLASWMGRAQDRGRGTGTRPIAQPDPRGALVARPRPGEVMADLGRRLEEAQARGLGDGGYAALGALSAERRAEARARAAGAGS
jgi:hypothetical protein